MTQIIKTYLFFAEEKFESIFEALKLNKSSQSKSTLVAFLIGISFFNISQLANLPIENVEAVSLVGGVILLFLVAVYLRSTKARPELLISFKARIALNVIFILHVVFAFVAYLTVTALYLSKIS